MKYTIYEQVETVSWGEATSKAPADMVKTAKEMTEKGEIAVFARALGTAVGYYSWVLLTVNDKNLLTVIKRDHNQLLEPI